MTLPTAQSAERDNADYSIHYVGIDSVANTTTVFYTYYTGGVRAFDVRDPMHPVEIAYYHPAPLSHTTYLPQFPPPGSGFDAHTPVWDAATSEVRYRPETGEVWFVSVAGGFQILTFTTSRRPPAQGSIHAAPTKRPPSTSDPPPAITVGDSPPPGAFTRMSIVDVATLVRLEHEVGLFCNIAPVVPKMP